MFFVKGGGGRGRNRTCVPVYQYEEVVNYYIKCSMLLGIMTETTAPSSPPPSPHPEKKDRLKGDLQEKKKMRKKYSNSKLDGSLPAGTIRGQSVVGSRHKPRSGWSLISKECLV